MAGLNGLPLRQIENETICELQYLIITVLRVGVNEKSAKRLEE